jgi:hypothetical protein
LGQNHVVETLSREQRAGGWDAETHRDGYGLVIFVVLRHDLPHVRAGRDLERAHVTPAKIHAVISEIGAAPEVPAGNHADAGADGELGLILGMPDGDYMLVDVLGILDDRFLTWRFVL